MNTYYLIKNGKNAGPYSESEVMSRVQSGSYALTDLAWFEGCTEPVPIAQVFAKTPPFTPAPAPEFVQAPLPPPAFVHTAAPETYSYEDLAKMADLQRKLLILGVCWILYCFIPVPESLQWMQFPAVIVATVHWIRLGWKLARLLQKNPWVWVVFSFIPLLNLCAWSRILWTAAQKLRANGIPCGLFGADQATLNRLGKAA